MADGQKQLAAIAEQQKQANAQLQQQALEAQGKAEALHKQLDETKQGLAQRVEDASRQVDKSESDLREARNQQETDQANQELTDAKAQQQFLSDLSNLCDRCVFNSDTAVGMEADLSTGNAMLQDKDYAGALAAFGKSSNAMTVLLGLPDQAERALKKRIETQQLIQSMPALGPIASGLDAVKQAKANANNLQSHADTQLAGGAFADALASYDQTQSAIGKVNTTAKQGLLAIAQSDANEQSGQKGLSALGELLTLDPGNSDGEALQQQIQKILTDAAERQRQEKIAVLIATARDNDNQENGKTALAALIELLKLDPQNAQALALQAKVCAYYKITNSIGMNLAYIPAGTFEMGSPASEDGRFDNETQHKVTISKKFLMGTTPVTQAQWTAVMGNNPSDFKGDDLPVEQVSYDDAIAFCDKLSQKEGKHYRLPTEAEWEYACRAGTTSSFYTGEGDAALDQAGWYSGNSGNTTHPVGQKKPNAWGLYDMHGNVWQWCSDWYGDYPQGDATDPQGPDGGTARVLRGGAWYYDPRFCRCAYRDGGAPDYRNGYFGFRIVLDSE